MTPPFFYVAIHAAIAFMVAEVALAGPLRPIVPHCTSAAYVFCLKVKEGVR